MDSTPKKHDIEAIKHKIRLLNRLLEIRQRQQQQPPPPPPPPSRLEAWLEKASPGVFQALFDILWPLGYRMTVLRSLVMHPLLTLSVVKSLFDLYFEIEWTTDATVKFVDALLIVSGYAITHLPYKMLPFVFRFISYLLHFIWRYRLWTCTLCGLVLGVKLFVSRQGIRITKIYTVIFDLTLWLTECMFIFHFRCSLLCRKIWALIKGSNGVRICKLYLKNGMLGVLGRPTFENLDPFTYSHRPLLPDQRQIRLLRLTRQNPIFDLQAELCCCSLDDAPPFEAISYVWGNDIRKNQQIILDGRQLYVSNNVYQILCRRGSLFGSRVIWIDSICIDQSDKVEKSEQVKMMRDIYKRSSHVSVCLGENPNAWLAWGMLAHLAYLSLFMSIERLTEQLFHILQVKDSNEWLSAQLTAFLDLLDHPWFNRVWVVQEVVVAQSVSILYGNYWISWDRFMRIMDILFNPGIDGLEPLFQHTGEGAITRPMPTGASQAAFMYGYREMFRMGQANELYSTLRLFLALKSTDPRDKVFALVGLTKTASELSYMIDYENPLPRVLVQVADEILKKGHILEVLHLAGIGWEDARTDIPSWVVDWSISRDPVTLAHSFVDDHLQYRAAVQRASQISRGSNRGHIRVRGQLIDHIYHVGTIMEGPDLNERTRPLEVLDDIIAWYQDAQEFVYRHAAAPYHNGQDLPEALWRTIMGDRTKSARPAPVTYETDFLKHKQFMLAIKDAVDRHGPGLNGIQQSPPDTNPLLDAFPSWDGVRDFLKASANFTWLCGIQSFPRKLAVTSRGYIAMVPKGTKSTDIICAIWGAQVPFVLRSLGSTANREMGMYFLVGECYVHGMMDGECFELPVDDEIFEIF